MGSRIAAQGGNLLARRAIQAHMRGEVAFLEGR